jgi:hypothetical protein
MKLKLIHVVLCLLFPIQVSAQYQIPHIFPPVDLGCQLFTIVPQTRTITWDPVKNQIIDVDFPFEEEREQEWTFSSYSFQAITPPSGTAVHTVQTENSIKYTAKVLGEHCFSVAYNGHFIYEPLTRFEGPASPILVQSLTIGWKTASWTPLPDNIIEAQEIRGYRVYITADISYINNPMMIYEVPLSSSVQFHVSTERTYYAVIRPFSFTQTPTVGLPILIINPK